MNSKPILTQEKALISCHQDKIHFLEKIIGSGNLPHAFLFSGPKGIGKSTLAYHFAKMILSIDKEENVSDKNIDEQDLFGEILTAKNEPAQSNILINEDISERIEKRNHLDLLVLEKKENDDKKNIGIDQVRNIAKFLSLTPAESKYRVAIIDSIDDFNLNSANAFLKMLEEPTPNTVLIIICHSKANLLPTIKSRCLEIKFKPQEKNNFISLLSKQGYEKNEIENIYGLSEGSPGKAKQMLDSEVSNIIKKYKEAASKDNIQNIISIAKEIKDKDIWKIFGDNFLKIYLEEIKSSKIINKKDLDNFSDLSEIFYYSNLRNMDIQDSLKTIRSKLKN